MKETRKFQLVPQHHTNTVNMNPGTSGLAKQVNEFRVELEKILQDTTRPTEEQYLIFNQLFQRYMNLQDEYRNRPLPVVIRSNDNALQQQQQQHSNDDAIPDENILYGIPKMKQTQAKSLLHHIKNTPRISWNDRGQVAIDGQYIPGSNIIDLVHDFTREGRSVPPAVGHEAFAAILKAENTPQ